MSLIHILDLDGTLMPSHAVDNRCYWAAVHEVFGTDPAVLALDQFSNVTDNGILAEWAGNTLGRTPRTAEITAVRERFLQRLEGATSSEPAAFTAFPGAVHWLRSQPPGTVAIATGGWEHSARFKLQAAGLDRLDLPLASADQGCDRTAIMRHALDLLPRGTRQAAEDITYLGDGPWDLAAARALGWGFLGIASGARADALREAGARRVAADFREL